jgi:hypothetical protein
MSADYVADGLAGSGGRGGYKAESNKGEFSSLLEVRDEGSCFDCFDFRFGEGAGGRLAWDRMAVLAECSDFVRNCRRNLTNDLE